MKPKRHLLGNNGLVRFEEPVNLIRNFRQWVQKGFPHHVCVVEGRKANLIADFCRQNEVIVLSEVPL